MATIDWVKSFVDSENLEGLKNIDKTYNTFALSYALYMRKTKSIVFLLNNGVNPNEFDNPLYESPLYHVLKFYEFNEDMVHIVETLLYNNVEFNTDRSLKSEIDEIIERFVNAQLQGITYYYQFVSANHQYANKIAKLLSNKSKTTSIINEDYLRRITNDQYFNSNDMQTFEQIVRDGRQLKQIVTKPTRSGKWRMSF